MGYLTRLRNLEARTPVQETYFGKRWFVDAKTGSNSNSGTTAAAPFLTMAKAFSVLESGDVIIFRGKIREQLDTPVGVHDVTIIGAANRPRHADDHTEDGNIRGSSSATWTAPASGSTAVPLLRFIQQGWRVERCVFQLSGSATACIGVHKTDDAGDSERDGAHAEIMGCKLQGTVGAAAGIGIQTNGNGFVCVRDNLLFGFATAMAKTGAAGGQVGWWEIAGNRFYDNTNGIVLPLYHSLVKGNYFGVHATKEVDLTGGAANIVTENVFLGDYDVNVAASGDSWFNNHSLDAASGEVDADGKTSSVPVA
jgi:hypothetical protein